ncbi:MAG: hypothetical protein WBQ37_13985 [Candidatus Competibacter sp.]
MTSHQAHCPSCTQTIHFPVIRFPVRPPAASTVRCPNCRVALRVRLDQLAALSSPDHHTRLDLSRAQPPRREGKVPKFGFSLAGDARISTGVCPHCQRIVTEYRFAAGGGLAIVTYHCAEHGDVVPTRDVRAPNDPSTLHS